MQYYSHYIWESGSGEKKNPVSVVLQQVSLNKHQYLLACVCDGRRSKDSGSLVSGYFTERLAEWFHQRHPGIKHQCKEEEILQAISKELKKITEELQEYGRQKNIEVAYDIWGILICDNQFWMFKKGDCKGYLFNRRFNRKQRKELQKVLLQDKADPDELLLYGRLQKNIGILLCSEAFGENISEEEMLQVLFEENLKDKDIQKRLGELWNENIRRGGTRYAGAVFFRTQ